MENTRQSQKVWSLVKYVIIMPGRTTAVTGVTILQSGTVGLSSSMSYKKRLLVISVTVVTAAEWMDVTITQSWVKQTALKNT